jgi:hypothetical protein
MLEKRSGASIIMMLLMGVYICIIVPMQLNKFYAIEVNQGYLTAFYAVLAVATCRWWYLPEIAPGERKES